MDERVSAGDPVHSRRIDSATRWQSIGCQGLAWLVGAALALGACDDGGGDGDPDQARMTLDGAVDGTAPTGDAGPEPDGGAAMDAQADGRPDPGVDAAPVLDAELEPDAEPDAAAESPALLGQRCSTAGLERAALPLEAALDPFRIAVGLDGTLDVRHQAEPARSIFTADAPWLRAGISHIEVTEAQGSFTVDVETEVTCGEPRLDEAWRSGEAVVIGGDFADASCRGLRWQMQLCPAAEPGNLGFEIALSDPDFDTLTLRTRSDANEAIYGMGQQFPHADLDLKGRVIPVLVQEGGVGRGHPVITPAVNLVSPGSAGSEDTTYYVAPHYITGRARSLALEETHYAEFDFSADDHIDHRLHHGTMNGRILYGADALDLIEAFTAWAGRMPAPPEWVDNGAIVALARPLDEGRAIVDDLRAAGAAIAGVWNQTWSGINVTFIGEQVLWNWIQNPDDHPGWDAWVAGLEADGMRALCYVNSMFLDVPEDALPVRRNLYAEGVEGGYFVRDHEGGVFLQPVTAFEVALLDLSNPDARDWMKAIIRDEMIGRAGCSGWMADFAEALPFEAELHSGEPAEAWHNRYPVEWMKLNREAIEEAGRLGDVLVFNRSGFTTTPRYSLLLWEGDQLTTWDEYDGIKSALAGLLGGGFSGIALNHSDTGGYTSLSRFGLGYSREAQLMKRWAEMNAFTAVLRTHEGNQPDANAQVYSNAEARAHFARFTQVYAALAFYRRPLFDEAAERGWPVVRHLMLHHPDDPVAATVHDQFLLGADVLVAPTLDKCLLGPLCDWTRRVYLPAGRWVHLWSGEVYGDVDMGGFVEVDAPVGEPAVFYAEASEMGPQLVENLRAAGIEAGGPD